MQTTYIVGNWKMHGDQTMVHHFCQQLKALTDKKLTDKAHQSHSQGVVCPPFPYLAMMQEALAETSIAVGAQNCAAYPQGAYTGEVSAAMLKSLGCEFVILGHSERRQLFAEDNAVIAEKCHQAQQAKLRPILCLGETLAQQQQGKTQEIIKNQLNSILLLENAPQLMQNALLAYEPIWAIGTGKTATPEQAQDVHRFIREEVAEYDQHLAHRLPILYGGSVKPDNAQALFRMPDINGALIGGASLSAKDFMGIYQCSL